MKKCLISHTQVLQIRFLVDRERSLEDFFFFHCNYLRLNNGYITAKLSSILFIQSFLLRRCFLLSNKGKSLTELLLQNFPLIILVGFFSMCYQMYNKRKSLISSIRRVSLHHDSSGVEAALSDHCRLFHSRCI